MTTVSDFRRCKKRGRVLEKKAKTVGKHWARTISDTSTTPWPVKTLQLPVKEPALHLRLGVFSYWRKKFKLDITDAPDVKTEKILRTPNPAPFPTISFVQPSGFQYPTDHYPSNRHGLQHVLLALGFVILLGKNVLDAAEQLGFFRATRVRAGRAPDAAATALPISLGQVREDGFRRTALEMSVKELSKRQKGAMYGCFQHHLCRLTRDGRCWTGPCLTSL